MQSSRLFSIVHLLLEKKKITAKELSEKFEVSVRTIYRDINTLNMAGIPIYADYGRNGGVRILDNYVLNKSVFTEHEQVEMLVGLQSLAATQYPDTNDILTKLASLFCKSDFNWIEVDFSRWGIDTVKEKRLFELLKTAIIIKQTIQCEYYNSKGISSTRKINPLKLLYKDRAWYLYGFCMEKQGFRLFKITRMAKAELTAEHFVIEYDYSVPITFDAESFGSIIDLELRFSCQAAHRVYDAFDNSLVRVAADGSLNVGISMPETEWLYSFLMSFGPDVEVVRPLHVKDNLRNKYLEALEKTT